MKALLLIFDLLFYTFMMRGQDRWYIGVACLLILPVYTFFVSRALWRSPRKALLALGIAGNAGVLMIFKYLGGFTGLAMPLGMSFYVFHMISLLADSYNKNLEREPGLVDTMIYGSFFVTVVSGPIIKARDFMKSLSSPRRPDAAAISMGVQRIAVGLMKKLVIADRLGVAVNAVYDAPMAYSGLSLLFASFAYSLQIYFDFGGYSDIAIGVGRILGFDIPENFNLPYLASGPSDFWSRWHISLSSWLREYIYIPLGGSRKGKARTCINIMITMLVSGIWHGSTWNFLLWGGLHGLWQVAHRLFIKERRISSLISVPVTFLLADLLWIPFRAKDLHDTWIIWSRIFTMAGGITYIYSYTLIFGAILIAVELFSKRRLGGQAPVLSADLGTFRGKIVFIMVICITVFFAYFGNSAFIYQGF